MLFDQVKDLMMETISCEEDKITPEAKLKEDVGLDSLDAMELGLALEEAFSLKIEEEDLKTFVTVQDIVDYLERKGK